MQNSQKLMPPLSGKCHCGKIEFELMCHLKDLKRCNCSHCRRKGFVMTTVKLDEFKLKCSIGKNGITNNKIEGDKKTPKGLYSLGNLYYRSDRLKKPATSLKCIKIQNQRQVQTTAPNSNMARTIMQTAKGHRDSAVRWKFTGMAVRILLLYYLFAKSHTAFNTFCFFVSIRSHLCWMWI